MTGAAVFHVECSVGRLLEIRPESLQSVDAVGAIGVAISRTVRMAGGGALLFCVDWRRLRVLAPDVADALTLLIKGGNSRIIRSAALISEHATFGLQIERVLRVAANPARRAFRDPEVLLEWISEVATEAELTQARKFLGS